MRVGAVLFMLVGATALFVAGQQGHEGDVGVTIRALEHEWVEAQTRNDNRALDLIFDNGLVYVEYGKLITKGEYLSRIRQAGPQVSQIVIEPMTVRTFGKTAIVVGTYRENQMQGKGRRVKRWRFVDTWVYKQHGWVLVAAAAAPVLK